MKYLSSLLLTLLLLCAGAHAAVVGTIDLTERLGGAFVPQVLHYTLLLPQGAVKSVTRLALKDAAGTPVLAQLKPLDAWEDGSLRHLQVTFISGLTPYEVKRFTLDDSGKAAKDDGALTISKDGDNLVLASPLAAVRIPALSQTFANGLSAKRVPPPILQVRGKARWYGSAALDSVQPVLERKVAVVDDGPITKKVSIEYTFAAGEKYVVDVVLNRGEELVRVTEDFSLTFTEPTRAQFAFNLAPGLNPDRSVCKAVQSPGFVASPGSLWDITPYRGEMFPISYAEDTTYGALTPWSAHPGQWVHFACYNAADADGDLVGIINTAPERWTHLSDASPEESWKLTQNPHMFFTHKLIKNVDLTVGAADRSLVAHFGLTTGHREWAFFIGAGFPRTEQFGEGGAMKSYGSGPRTYFTQKTRDYFWNALDRIKDYTLAWTPDPALAYPHIYASKDEWETRRQRFNAWYGKPLPALDDPATRAKLKAILANESDSVIRQLTTNPGPPHHVSASIYLLANLSDLVLGTGTLTPDEEARLKARLAYAAYLLNWRGYWGPEMGYAANPNMTSFCYDAIGLIGLLLRDHPESDTWVGACTTEMDREFANWASEDGAWIESIHYVRAAWQEHTMLMAALKHNGVKDYYRDPHVQRFFRYYFAMQNPPDPEWGRQRGSVQIGNSYVFEPVKEFGAWAAGMADVDPVFAGNLMWMYQEAGFGTAAAMQGKKLPGYGASYEMWFGEHLGAPAYWQPALFDPSVKAVTPTPSAGAAYKGFGAVLSGHGETAKETKLYFRQGPFYSHWDSDQGSFVLWAKGAPLCMDHGYGEFQPWLHNRISANHLNDGELGNVTGFFAGNGAGFVKGETVLDNLSKTENGGVKAWPLAPEPINGRAMRTPWTRRIVMMKDDDPDGPNYLVMRDTINGALPTEWCLWVYGDVADFTTTPVRASGKFGVDLLVYLLDKDKGTVGTATVAFPADRRKQTLIHLKRPAGRGVLSVLFPILAGQPAPTVTTIANGAGVKVQAGVRTDWVFLPEGRVPATADGLTATGAAAFAKYGEVSYYWLDRLSTLATPGLTVGSTFPCELFVRGGQVKGRVTSRDARPVITLTGPVAGRLTTLTCNGTTTPVRAKDNTLTLILPLGETEFTLALQ